MVDIGKIMPNPKLKENLSKYGFRVDQQPVLATDAQIRKVNTMADAYLLTSAVVDTTVYDQETGHQYRLNSLPSSNPANWSLVGDGDAEDSYRAVSGNFDPKFGGQHINANQTISSISLPVSKVYKFYFDVDCSITFDIPILGHSPMISADRKTWGFFAGDEFEFFKTADGSAIDGEAN